MNVTEKTVLEALSSIRYPGFRRDIVSFGVVRGVRIDGGTVRLRLDLGSGDPAVAEPLRQEVRTVLEAIDGVESTEVRVTTGSPSDGLGMANQGRPTVAQRGGIEDALLPGVKRIVAVASGKGGVGKSTVAVNLAAALAFEDVRVGLLDADVYGPSIPLMLGVDAQPELNRDENLVPFERHGIRFMSLGFLLPADTAVVWRGPLVMKAIDDLIRRVAWGELDVLVVDMPPGTGDVQLTMAQKVDLAGAVIVTTPQDVALADAVKGVDMFNKVNVPVLGIVENMSYFSCPHCLERTDIFGHGGGRQQADRLGVPFLGDVPLDPAIRSSGDDGNPIVVADPESPQTTVFRDIATRMLSVLDLEPRDDADTGARSRGMFARFRGGT